MLKELKDAYAKALREYYNYKSDGTIHGDKEERKLMHAFSHARIAYEAALDEQIEKEKV